MTKVLGAALLGTVLSVLSFCQTNIYLKNRHIDTRAGLPQQGRRPPVVMPAEVGGRVHLIVQFTKLPGDAESAALRALGAVVLSYVHENGLLISIDPATPLDNLGVQWSGRLEPADKVSSLIEEDAAPVLVEVHTDVNPDDARALLLGLGVSLQDNPDLASNQLLVRASREQVDAIAQYDAIAYIFPASGDLAAGRPSLACASALTQQGRVGQVVATVGDGWDGPGLGSAALTVSWGPATSQLPVAAAQAEVLRALNEWAKVAQVSFTESGDSSAARNIAVLFGRRSHGDAYPFDGPGGVLAHTFYPSPPNPEPLAGDMHFDDDESWHIGADMDLFSVALHEAGHALGLGHSDKTSAVMYPYYRRASQLTGEDIDAILTLYAARATKDPTPAPPAPPAPAPAPPLTLTVAAQPAITAQDSASISGSSSGGSGSVSIRWTSDRGYAGSAMGTASWTFNAPLAPGVNYVTITATDGQNTAVSKTVSITRQASPPVAAAVTIQLTYPATAGATYTTSLPSISLRGTASHPSGIVRVQWSNNRGGSGLATGAGSWQTGDIALLEGLNTITVQATSTDNRTASLLVQITYSRSTTGARDTTAPSLTVTSPANPYLATSAAAMVVQGTASDNTAVTAVDWITAGGASGKASGTTNWSTPPIPLYLGFNTIVIRAFDAAGNMAWRVVQVTRTR